MSTKCLLPLLSLITLLLPTMASSSVISDDLLTKLKGGEKATVIVKMARETKEVLDQIDKQNFPNREERANAVTNGLKALADESQKHVKAYLDSLSPKPNYESLWISNSLVVREATLEMVEGMAKVGGIKEIREEMTVHIMPHH